MDSILPIHSSETSPSLHRVDAPFTANVQKVLEFLKKDTTYVTEVTNKELDLIKAHVDTVNSFIVVVRTTASPKRNVAHSIPQL